LKLRQLIFSYLFRKNYLKAQWRSHQEAFKKPKPRQPSTWTPTETLSTPTSTTNGANGVSASQANGSTLHAGSVPLLQPVAKAVAKDGMVSQENGKKYGKKSQESGNGKEARQNGNEKGTGNEKENNDSNIASKKGKGSNKGNDVSKKEDSKTKSGKKGEVGERKNGKKNSEKKTEDSEKAKGKKKSEKKGDESDKAKGRKKSEKKDEDAKGKKKDAKEGKVTSETGKKASAKSPAAVKPAKKSTKEVEKWACKLPLRCVNSRSYVAAHTHRGFPFFRRAMHVLEYKQGAIRVKISSLLLYVGHNLRARRSSVERVERTEANLTFLLVRTLAFTIRYEECNDHVCFPRSVTSWCERI
jgi:hypothetical protein